MAKHLLENAAAEKEANDVGFRYMNSSDVLSDMIRDYGGALDGVKVHDDAAADAKVRAVGRDGLASGKDVYMREGSLSSGDPAAKGLLAHELTHVMQQDGGAQESVDYGEAQGGLIDWFKGKFGKKKKEPEIQWPSSRQWVKEGAVKNDDGSFKWGNAVYKDMDQLMLAMELQNATPEQRKSPEMQQRVLADFNTDMGAEIGRQKAAGNWKIAFRQNNMGALKNLNTVIKAMQGEGYADSIFGQMTEEQRAQLDQYRIQDRDYKRAVKTSPAEVASMDADKRAAHEAALAAGPGQRPQFIDDTLDSMGRGIEDSELGEFLLKTQGAFTSNGIGLDDFSTMMTNNVLLRGGFGDAVTDPKQSKNVRIGQLIMQQANYLTDDAEAAKKSVFAGSLSRLFKRKQSQAAAAPAPAPAPVQPQTPAAPVQKPQSLMSYQSDEVGDLVQRFKKNEADLDPTSDDPKVMAAWSRIYYDKIKQLQKSGASSEEIREAVRMFQEARQRQGTGSFR
ncbi:MAG: DUF4157 domain-containing protein [Lachnospiraceae bacterium]|nr:DUF4157 domain-containing protein [Lachnospiraceae bacterium]